MLVHTLELDKEQARHDGENRLIQAQVNLCVYRSAVDSKHHAAPTSRVFG